MTLHQSNNPGEFRFVAIADAHLSEHTPASWKPEKSYQHELDAALWQVFVFAKSKAVDGVLWPGDIFNIKSANRNSLGFMRYVINLFKSDDLKHFAIAGNHDYRYNSEPSSEAYETQPLGVLEAAGCITILTPEGVGFRAYPEDDEQSFTLKLAGASYEFGDAATCYNIQKEAFNYLVALGHFPFGVKDGESYGQRVYSPEWLQDSQVDCFVLGDTHADQGYIVDKKHRKVYVAQGSISQIGEPASSNRRPAAAYIVIKDGETSVTILRPRVTPLGDLLDTNRNYDTLAERQSIDSYINELKSTGFHASTPEEILQSTAVEMEIREAVEKYLALADAETS